jgi:hypothetical protein
MTQVDDKIVKIHLDMRLLDQYRVRYNKHTTAEDLVKMMVSSIDSLLSKFAQYKRSTKVFYFKIKAMKVEAIVYDERDRFQKKDEIKINLQCPEASKIFNLCQLRSKIFEDSLFGMPKTEGSNNESNQAKICNVTTADHRTIVRKEFQKRNYSKKSKRKHK